MKSLKNSGKMEEVLLILTLLTPLGIAMTRAGLGPRKSFVSSLLRPFLHLTIGTAGFWLVGSGFVSHGNPFIGYENFLFLKSESESLYQVTSFFPSNCKVCFDFAKLTKGFSREIFRFLKF